jgi:hypothetical protein
MHDQLMQRDRLSRPGLPARTNVATGLLAAAAVGWAAFPMSGAGTGARPVLIAAISCAILAAVHLAVRPADENAPVTFAPLVVRAWWQVTALMRAVPWAEGTVVAALALEALHPSRPGHTALLGAALLGYLFGTHLAETGARAGSLRPQLPLIAAGLGLLALAAGAAALPAGSGAASGWLRVLAVAAALIVGVLIIPV